MLEPGSDADIGVWDPEMVWTLSKETQQSAAGYCPLEGTQLKGRAQQVYLRGELIAENGQILKENQGIYILH